MSVPDPDAVLAEVGFDAEESVLTRRQAQVLALRERGFPQAAIADRLGTSRANVSGIEASARENVARSRETVAFADALAAPVRVPVEPGTDLFDVPDLVYEACDETGIEVARSAAGLLRTVREQVSASVDGDVVTERLVVVVSADGLVDVRRPEG